MVVLQHAMKAKGRRLLTGATGRAWQTSFEKALRDVRLPAWSEINKLIMDELKGFAVIEASAAIGIMNEAMPVILGLTMPSTASLIGIVNSQPFEGRTLKKWLERTSDVDAAKLTALAKTGIVQGLTPTQVARSAVGTKALKYRDGAARKAFKNLESVLLTTTSGIQQTVRQQLYAANSDIIQRELFVTTLDGRTTLVCMGNSAKTFKIGEGPIPPLHFRCRSTRVPYFNAANLGTMPFNAEVEKEFLADYTKSHNLPSVSKRGRLAYGHKTKFDAFARIQRKKVIGQVPVTLGYNDWLKGQTTLFQNEVLGVTRAKMFRKGTLHLDKFTNVSGRTLTLLELEAKGYAVPGGG